MTDLREHEVQGEAMKASPPVRRTAWTSRQRIVRLLWATVGRVLWQVPAFRSSVLRLFGGTVGARCRFARSVQITIPWNTIVGDDVQIGERVILYGLGPIRIGSGCVIDVRAHFCAGSHDMRDTRFPLTRPPITIGEKCFIGVDAYIAPDVELGSGCRVQHRASVYKSFPAGTTLEGNPARSVDDDA
jgi:putative colanic acid biosynthesis acetyltransferase WcaF